jgi:hypothetical protein
MPVSGSAQSNGQKPVLAAAALSQYPLLIFKSIRAVGFELPSFLHFRDLLWVLCPSSGRHASFLDLWYGLKSGGGRRQIPVDKIRS